MEGAQKGHSEYRASWGQGNSGSGLEAGATGLTGGRGLLCKHSVTFVRRTRPSCSRPGAEHPSRQGAAGACVGREGGTRWRHGSSVSGFPAATWGSAHREGGQGEPPVTALQVSETSSRPRGRTPKVRSSGDVPYS